MNKHLGIPIIIYILCILGKCLSFNTPHNIFLIYLINKTTTMNFTPKLETTQDRAEHKKYEPVTRYMATQLVTFKPDQEVGTVIETLRKKQISGAPVLNEKNELIGIISEQDCLRVIIDSVYHNQPISKHRVEEYMNKEVVPVSINDDVVQVAHMFLKYRFRRFPVVDGKGVLKGLVSKRDILAAAQKIRPSTW